MKPWETVKEVENLFEQAKGIPSEKADGADMREEVSRFAALLIDESGKRFQRELDWPPIPLSLNRCLHNALQRYNAGEIARGPR